MVLVVGSYCILLDEYKSEGGLDEMRDVISVDEPSDSLLAAVIGSIHSCWFRSRGAARRASLVQGHWAAPDRRILDGCSSGKQFA